jgi:hypothetical protein
VPRVTSSAFVCLFIFVITSLRETRQRTLQVDSDEDPISTALTCDPLMGHLCPPSRTRTKIHNTIARSKEGILGVDLLQFECCS